MADKPVGIAPRQTQTRRREPLRSTSGLTVFDRFADEMDRLFDDFGFGRRWLSPRGSQKVSGIPSRVEHGLWAPDVEVYHENNELIVRADLPGLKKDDVSVEVTDSDITISGERRQEQGTEKGGLVRVGTDLRKFLPHDRSSRGSHYRSGEGVLQGRRAGDADAAGPVGAPNRWITLRALRVLDWFTSRA